MSDRDSGPDEGDLQRAFEELLKSRFIEGLVRQLEQQFRVRNTGEAEDAVAEATRKVVATSRKRRVDNLRAYLARVAWNEMRRRARRPPTDEFEERHLKSTSAPPDGEVVAKDVYDWLCELIRPWANATMRTVTLLYLEAAYYGEYLSLAEAAEKTGEILGQEIQSKSIGKWKERGMRRLAAKLRDLGLWPEDLAA